MLISERAAAEVLAGVGLSREPARLLLRTGVAGRGERVGRVVAYDESRVRCVAARPVVDELDLARRCPQGVFVARLGRDRTIDAHASWEEQARAVSVQPRLPR